MQSKQLILNRLKATAIGTLQAKKTVMPRLRFANFFLINPKLVNKN